jgi:hypothetical protein
VETTRLHLGRYLGEDVVNVFDGSHNGSVIGVLNSSTIEVGTPVSPDAPLADPGVRNYRTGLLRKRAFETSSDTECQSQFPLQAGSVTQWSGSTWPVVSALLALLPAHSFAL